jgi:tryptophanyl-tRNA synthetase
VIYVSSIRKKKDPAILLKSIREMAITLLACGINPEKAIVYNQSKVAAHTELMWILSCMTPIGWLSKMIQFKVRI